MGWTTPTTRATGYLVLATDWNTDLVDNLAYLRGQAGVVTLEAGIASDTHNTDDLGTKAIEWKAGYFVNLYASRFKVGPNLREVRLPWNVKDEDGSSRPDEQVIYTETGSGSTIRPGGTGQIVLEVDDDAGGARSVEIEQQSELNNALDNQWFLANLPYMRAEFSMNADRDTSQIFIGFRTTPGIAIPTTEHHAGIQWTGTQWQSTHSGGTQGTEVLSTSPVVVGRNIVEIYLNNTTDMEVWINGVRETVITTNLPTSNMDWQVLLNTDGLGGATVTRMTLGQMIFQMSSA